MTLVIIGEAVSRLMRDHPDYIAAHADIPWIDIRNMRNRGVHGYDDLNFSIVWDTLTLDLPLLAQQTIALLQEFGGPLPPPDVGHNAT